MDDGMMAIPMPMKAKGMDMPLPMLPNLPAQQWNQWLLPIVAVTTIKTKNKRKRLKAIILDPAYQLK